MRAVLSTRTQKPLVNTYRRCIQAASATRPLFIASYVRLSCLHVYVVLPPLYRRHGLNTWFSRPVGTYNLTIVIDNVCTVCVPAGYLLSYWNRPFFPEFCSDASMDDSSTYDTMTRIAGSWAGVAQVFKAIANKYNWTNFVLVSDDETKSYCWYGAKPFEEVFAYNENYSFTWLRLGSDPSNKELDYLLQQILARARGYLCSVQARNSSKAYKMCICFTRGTKSYILSLVL